MLRSHLCHYSYAYILVKGTITVVNTRTCAAPNNTDRKIISKSCAPCTSCLRE